MTARFGALSIRLPAQKCRYLELLVPLVIREQVVGIGKRRYLMKRAMAGIVPDEILNRRRKAFAPPEQPTHPRESFSEEWPTAAEIGQYVLSSAVGIVDQERFLEALESARRGQSVLAHSLKRTLTIEAWLRHLNAHGVLSASASTNSAQNVALPKPVGADKQSRATGLASLGAEERQWTAKPGSPKVSAS